VVTLNYRVGALGFADLVAHGRDANAGLSDVVAALEWVGQYVADLGGDPTNVTLAGHSAGAFLVGALAAVPRSRGLYRRVAMLSGGPWRVVSSSRAQEMASDFLERLALRDDEDLDQVDVSRILKAQDELGSDTLVDRFGPDRRVLGVVQEMDGQTLLAGHPGDAVAGGAWKDVPLLLTWTADEFLGFTDGADERAQASIEPLLASLGASPAHAATLMRDYAEDARGVLSANDRLLSDWMYVLPAARTAIAQAQAGGAAWLGEIHRGAVTPHGADVTDLFPQAEDATSVVCDMLLTFANSGNPGWSAVKPTQPSGVLISDGEVSGVVGLAGVLERWQGIKRT